jgi:hypothetical protein
VLLTGSIDELFNLKFGTTANWAINLERHGLLLSTNLIGRTTSMAVVADSRDVFTSAEIGMTGVWLALSIREQMASYGHTNLQHHGKS